MHNHSKSGLQVNPKESSSALFDAATKYLLDNRIVRDESEVSAHIVADMLAMAMASYISEMKTTHNKDPREHLHKSIDLFTSQFIQNKKQSQKVYE